MPLMEWNDSLKTGHSTIDVQHKKLVDLLNQLAEAMSAGKAKAICGTVLNELIAYTKTHFSTEEQLMGTHRYSNSVPHKAEHDKFVADVLAFKAKFEAGALTLSISVMQFLQDWLTNHIKGTDKAMVAELPKA